jgi:hypothetical protein
MLIALPLMLLAGTLLDISTNDDSNAPDPAADPNADHTVSDTPADQEPIL